MEQVRLLNARCDDLQSQIRANEEAKRQVEEKRLEMAQETLLGRKDFFYLEEDTGDEDEAELIEGYLPRLSHFEGKAARHKR